MRHKSYAKEIGWYGWAFFSQCVSLESESMKPTLELLYCMGEDPCMEKAREAQEPLLEDILEQNKNTRFGREHLFREIKDADDFRRCVPLFMYHDIAPYIQLMASGESSALVAEPYTGWVETVDTSGEATVFPYTESAAARFKNAFLHIFGSRIEDWRYVRQKVLCGLEGTVESTGSMLSLGAQTFKKSPILKSVVTPILDIDSTKVKKKWDAAVRQVAKQNVFCAVADPVLFTVFLHKITEITDQDMDELWPYFSLLISPVCPTPYKHMLNTMWNNVECRQLFSTDGMVIGVQTDEKGITPLYDSVFFEFISIDQWAAMVREGESYREFEFDVKCASTVTPGEYVLAVTAPGMYRYISGDVVRVTDAAHMKQCGYIDTTHVPVPEQLVLLREVAQDGLSTDGSHQLVAVESEPLGYLFGI